MAGGVWGGGGGGGVRGDISKKSCVQFVAYKLQPLL